MGGLGDWLCIFTFPRWTTIYSTDSDSFQAHQGEHGSCAIRPLAKLFLQVTLSEICFRVVVQKSANEFSMVFTLPMYIIPVPIPFESLRCLLQLILFTRYLIHVNLRGRGVQLKAYTTTIDLKTCRIHLFPKFKEFAHSKLLWEVKRSTGDTVAKERNGRHYQDHF